MLFALLVLLQSGAVLVVADQRELVAFARLDRIGDGRAADDEPVVLDAGQVLEFFELAHEGGFVLGRHFRPEFEEDCGVTRISES